MNQWHALFDWFYAALAGMAAPAVIAVALILTTFLLEDVAIAAGIALAAAGTISWTMSLASVGGGIALGDVGLYGLGAAATRIDWLRTRTIGDKSARIHSTLLRQLPSAVMLARVIPGLRLVTYTACGFLRLPILVFSGWVLISVFFWTTGLFVLSVAVGQQLTHYLHIPLSIAATLPIVCFAFVVPIVRAKRHRTSKASTYP